MSSVINWGQKNSINQASQGLPPIDSANHRRLSEKRNGTENNTNNQNVNFSHPDSIHSRLTRLVITFSALQKRIIDDPEPVLSKELVYVSEHLRELCDENIYQVLGELYLSGARSYSHIKPLYIAASLHELVKRYNQYNPEGSVSAKKNLNLIQAALLHNLGLLNYRLNVYGSQQQLTPDQRDEMRRLYPQQSAQMAQKIGVSENEILETISQHNVESRQLQFETQFLRMPFVYAGIAMRENMSKASLEIINPTREFARLFAEDKLDPILGGLFLKINGLAPVGAIMKFDSREKALIISGPNEINITSSTLRMISNHNGFQLGRPGEPFRLDRTHLVQKGLADHHAFAWSKFSPFAAWEK